MGKIFLLCVVAACASVSFCLSCGGETPAPSAEAKADENAAGEEQPKPEDLLRKMADYLGNLPAFSCRINATIEIKARGMDNRMETKMAVRIERPNRIAVVVEEGVMGMTLVSDGKQLVQYLPMMSRYTVQDAPADFSAFSEDGAMAGGMIGMSGIVIPTSGDEFYKKLMDGVTKSEYVGTEKVGDVTCHRCRFEQEEFTWDIWIEAGDRPLPHKIVPDMSKQFGESDGVLQDAKMEYMMAFAEWNVAPKFTEADFAFDPPASAQKVDSLMGGDEAEEGPHPLLGQPAPPFETVDAEGEPIDLAKQIGQNVIMLDFWATWCGPCVKAIPEVDAVAEKFADRGLVFYAVNSGEDADTVKEFLKTSALDVPVAMDVDSKINGLYVVEGIPQTVLIGKDGTVQVVHVGYSGALAKELTQNIEDLLTGKDLASEILAKAEEARKKRSADNKQVESAGMTAAWSVPGRWSGVGVHAKTGTAYVAGEEKAAVIDEAGNLGKQIAIEQSGNLRLANLIGDEAPELIVFQTWGNGVKAFDAAGESLWDYTAGQGIDDVWPADLNADGSDEVIIGYNGGTGLHALDQRGTPLWKFTDIGNVWHVAAGDFNADEEMDVVTTSAKGDLHVFSADGKKLKDIDVSVYANMVRMTELGDGSQAAVITGSGDDEETLLVVNFEGDEKASVRLPQLDVDHVDDMAIAPTVRWAAVAMRGGLIHVVDLDAAGIVARVSGQGSAPQVAWLPRNDQSPLLLVATGKELNAFEITPSDLDTGTNSGEPDNSIKQAEFSEPTNSESP